MPTVQNPHWLRCSCYTAAAPIELRSQHHAVHRCSSPVVLHKLGHHPSAMTLVDHDHVIETLCADGLNEPFRNRVGLWRPRRRPHAGDSEAADPRIEVPAVDAVPVVDEVRGLAIPRCRLKQLLPDPSRRRTGSDVEVDQFTALVADAEEDIEDVGLKGGNTLSNSRELVIVAANVTLPDASADIAHLAQRPFCLPLSA